jgi:hypothetical protein
MTKTTTTKPPTPIKVWPNKVTKSPTRVPGQTTKKSPNS